MVARSSMDRHIGAGLAVHIGAGLAVEVVEVVVPGVDMFTLGRVRARVCARALHGHGHAPCRHDVATCPNGPTSAQMYAIFSPGNVITINYSNSNCYVVVMTIDILPWACNN